MSKVTITGTSGFFYYHAGTLVFDVDGQEVRVHTVHSTSQYLVLSPEGAARNAQIIGLLNTCGEDFDGTAEEELDHINIALGMGMYDALIAEVELRAAAAKDPRVLI